MDGSILLVPAASTGGGGRGGAQRHQERTVPLGWVAYALPAK
jgi:hypothetical protein